MPVSDAELTASAECTPRGFQPNPGFQASLLQYDLTRGGSLFQFLRAATVKEQSAYVQDSMRFGRLGIDGGFERIDMTEYLAAACCSRVLN